MFGKSFSQAAVAKAAEQIRYYESNVDMLFEAFPPELSNGWAITKKERRETFISQHRGDPNIRLQFAHGVIVSVCDHFFDGKSKHLDDFQKKVIHEVFDYGFMMNMGKAMHSGFTSKTHKASPHHLLGLQWAKRFYIQELMVNGLNVSAYLSLREATERYHETKFFDPEHAEKLLDDAEISKHTHHNWCLGTVKCVEDDFFHHGTFSGSLIKKFQLSEGAPNFSSANNIFEFCCELVPCCWLEVKQEIRRL